MRFRETLLPAYGRDYTGKDKLIADLVADKDFIAEPSGQYINLSQLRELGVTRVSARYKRKTAQVILVITPEDVRVAK